MLLTDMQKKQKVYFLFRGQQDLWLKHVNLPCPR